MAVFRYWNFRTGSYFPESPAAAKSSQATVTLNGRVVPDHDIIAAGSFAGFGFVELLARDACGCIKIDREADEVKTVRRWGFIRVRLGRPCPPHPPK